MVVSLCKTNNKIILAFLPVPNGKSNGLYNTIKKSPLSDSPTIGNELREVIRDYMTKYKEQKGTTACYTHLNKKYGLHATSTFYKNYKEIKWQTKLKQNYVLIS